MLVQSCLEASLLLRLSRGRFLVGGRGRGRRLVEVLLSGLSHALHSRLLSSLLLHHQLFLYDPVGLRQLLLTIDLLLLFFWHCHDNKFIDQFEHHCHLLQIALYNHVSVQHLHVDFRNHLLNKVENHIDVLSHLVGGLARRHVGEVKLRQDLLEDLDVEDVVLEGGHI